MIYPRWMFLSAMLLLSTLTLVILSLALPAGSPMAMLLLDKQAANQGLFPYPLTFQNAMTVVTFVAIGELLFRAQWAGKEQRFLQQQLLPEKAEVVIVQGDLAALRQRLKRKSGKENSFLCKLIDQCLLNFQSTGNSSSAHEIFDSLVELELHSSELRYNTVRYLCWLLPTLGFVGTVVGIAVALSDFSTAVSAGKTVRKLLPGMSANLGMAFYTTIVALCYSAVLVWLMQWIQNREETRINQCAEYCLTNFLNRLYTP